MEPRDGLHETSMVWVYDEGTAKGANFIPFGMTSVDPTSIIEVIALSNYTRVCIGCDAISFANGLSHADI